MRAGEAKVALECRARELDMWLVSTSPVHPDCLWTRNEAAERDAVERAAHREMVSRTTPARTAQEVLEEDKPRLEVSDVRNLGIDYFRNRKAHASAVAEGRSSLGSLMEVHRFEGQVCQSLIEDKLSSLSQAWEHANHVRMAREELSDIQIALINSADVPSVLFMHAPSGQPLHETVEKYAVQWRERVVLKGIMDALERAFPVAAQPTLQPAGQEAALLRSHILYSDMFCAALREMRKHPDAAFDPPRAERKVRRMVLDAIGEGGDPMDAVVHGIQMAINQGNPAEIQDEPTTPSPR